MDKSLFCHRNRKAVWLLGAVDNISKDFRIEGSYERDSNKLRKFITSHIAEGNNIIMDGWSWYNFLGEPSSGYIILFDQSDSEGYLDWV